eukprot:TRINITY_DN14371_c0_g1_i1.p1 TRINITY_DN14371_c0_g1~~TRINITY_DN14371_c0_g1_i1.p1  ORF type:complete len:193 (+),score=-16.22 TRINITY_DN14371_c0_g1_i1:386-964(+)
MLLQQYKNYMQTIIFILICENRELITYNLFLIQPSLSGNESHYSKHFYTQQTNIQLGIIDNLIILKHSHFPNYSKKILANMNNFARHILDTRSILQWQRQSLAFPVYILLVLQIIHYCIIRKFYMYQFCSSIWPKLLHSIGGMSKTGVSELTITRVRNYLLFRNLSKTSQQTIYDLFLTTLNLDIFMYQGLL